MKGFIILLSVLAISKTYDWSSVDKIIQDTINNGGFPGAALRIANKTHVLYSNNYGTLTINTPPFSSPPVTNETIYDIASLSKIAGTLGCI